MLKCGFSPVSQNNLIVLSIKFVVVDLARRPATPKMKVSARGRILVPTSEDQYRLDVREGETFEVRLRKYLEKFISSQNFIILRISFFNLNQLMNP